LGENVVVKTIKMLNPPPIAKDSNGNGKMHIEKLLKYLKDKENNIYWIEFQGYFQGNIWYFKIEFQNVLYYWRDGEIDTQDEYLVMEFHLDTTKPYINYEHYYIGDEISKLNKRYVDEGRIVIVFDNYDEQIEKLRNYLRRIAIRSLRISK